MKNGLSARQLAVASFTGLLSLAAGTAGVDWRGAVLAIPITLGVAWCWGQLGKDGGGWTGRWKGLVGKGLSLCYIVWGVTLAGAVLGSAGERVVAPGNGGTGWVVLLLCLPIAWMAWGKPAAFGRAAEIFYLAMGAALVLVLLFGVVQIRLDWLIAEGSEFWHSLLSAIGVGCSGVAAVLLWDGGEKQHWLPWSGATAVSVALLAVVTTGVLSPALAAIEERPFFVMTMGLNKTARIEGLVSGVWLLADVTLAGILLQCGRHLWKVAGLPWVRGISWLLVLSVLGVGLLLQWTQSTGLWLSKVLPLVSLVLGGGVPTLAYLLKKWRERVKGA